MADAYANTAKMFKAFCDEKRLRILEILQEGEQCVCVLNARLDLPQSTMSYHLKVLCAAGIVEGRQRGKWTHYRIREKGAQEALTRLAEITRVQDGPAPEQPACCGR